MTLASGASGEPGREQLLSPELERSIPWIIRNGVGIQIMETLAVGAFLVAYAIELGASNFVIGLLAATPHLSQLAQVPALLVVDRHRDRRRVYVIAGIIGRPMMLVIAGAAFIPDKPLALAVIVVAFAIRYMSGAFVGCAWGSWMRDLVPDRMMGEVFGARQKKMIFIGAVLSLLAAVFVDLWTRRLPLPPAWGYAVIYALAFVGGAYSVYTSRRIHEPPMEGGLVGQHWLEQLREPLQNLDFRRVIAFLASWNLAVNLAAPFFTVHMLKRMQLDLAGVMALGVLSQMAAYLMVSQWGHIADRFSNKSVLSVCAPMFILCIFAWIFTMFPERHLLTVPLLIAIHVATGVASAGVSLASSNITLKLAPRGNATAYLAVSSLINSLAAGSAAMIGGLTADFFVSRRLSVVLRYHEPMGDTEFSALSFAQWDFFFLLAGALGLYALHRLSLVREEGHVREGVVIEALLTNARRGVRNLSTIAGLRAATEFPLEWLRRSGRKESSSSQQPPAD